MRDSVEINAAAEYFLDDHVLVLAEKEHTAADDQREHGAGGIFHGFSFDECERNFI